MKTVLTPLGTVVCMVLVATHVGAQEELPRIPAEEEPAEEVFLDEPVIPAPKGLEGETDEEIRRRILNDAFQKRPATIPINRQLRVNADGTYSFAPGRVFQTVEPGEKVTVTVTLLSRAGEDAIYEFSMRDVFADPETGAVKYLGPGLDGPHPAKDWIVPAVDEIALHHGERAEIPVTITVPRKVDAGDHLGSLLVRRKRIHDTVGGVKVNAHASAIFVVTVPGDVVEDAAFLGFSPAKYVNFHYPINLLAKIRNTGTVFVKPTGSITISNIFGIPVDEINIPRWHVLRESTHTKRIDWEPQFALGLYRAVTDLEMTASVAKHPLPVEQRATTFWVIPLIPLLIVIAAVFLVSFLVQLFFSRFEIRSKSTPSEEQQ